MKIHAYGCANFVPIAVPDIRYLVQIEPPPPPPSTLTPTDSDSEHKFYKMGIENCLSIEFNPALITTVLCSVTNGESLKVLYTHS